MENIPLWLAFALQLYLDIHNGLRDEVHHTFANLSNVATILHMPILKKNTLEIQASLRVGTWPTEIDDPIVHASIEAEIMESLYNHLILHQFRWRMPRVVNEMHRDRLVQTVWAA